MFTNYIKTAWRNFYRSRVYSLINIFGLAIGLATVIMIFLYVKYETDYDNQHSKRERIYRQINIGKEYNDPIQPGIFMEFQRGQIPGVEHVTMMLKNDLVVRVGDKKLSDQEFLVTDSCFFRIFDFKVVSGNPDEILKKPNTTILTESSAKLYFGDEDPIGKEILIENTYRAVVGGIIEDIPRQSFVHFTGILPTDYTLQVNESAIKNWFNSSFHYYSLLSPGADPEQVSMALNEVWNKNVPDERIKGNIRLQPLKDIHLHSENIRWEIEPQGSITVVRIFSLTAILILILACVNFVNLSTAQNVKRYREIGLRRVIGASRKSIVRQFLIETTMYILLALMLGIALVEISIPWFSEVYGFRPDLSVMLEPSILSATILFLILLIIITGSYPAFVLSSFQPADALRSRGEVIGKTRKQRAGIREGLVIFQFIISVGLITGAFIVKKQFNHLSGMFPGFEKHQKLVISNPWDENMNSRFNAFKGELARMPGIMTTASHNVPGDFQNNYLGVHVKGLDKEANNISTAFISVENNFFDVMGARISEGNNFPQDLTDIAKDSLPLCIINETLAGIIRNQGIEEPVGEYLSGFWDKIPSRRIIGVVEDIHYRSLHNKVYPAVFIVSKQPYPNYVLNMIVDIDRENLGEAYREIEDAWNRVSQDWPFRATFLDNKLQELYVKEANLVRIIEVFTFLALAISLIGLTALVMFSLRNRIKELSIRKVLGASPRLLFWFYSWKYVRLVLLADIIALPLIYYLGKEWLEQFAFRIDITIWILMISVVVSVVITVITISYQTYRASRINPADSLKYE